MNDPFVTSLINITVLTVLVWMLSYGILEQFRGKLFNKYIKSWSLWIASDFWCIVLFFKEFY